MTSQAATKPEGVIVWKKHKTQLKLEKKEKWKPKPKI